MVWLAILAVYKILIILGGILIIGLVRREVTARKIYDDSRSVATALYITSAAFFIGILFSLSNQVVLIYIASTTWVNISSSTTLICVFMPKFYRIIIKKPSTPTMSTGPRGAYCGKRLSTMRTMRTRTASPEVASFL